MKTRTILTALTAAIILTLIIAPNIIWALTLPIIVAFRYHTALTLTAIVLITAAAYPIIRHNKKPKNQ